MQEVFREIYEHNGWRNDESVSGSGSTFAATHNIRQLLPDLFARRDINTVLDVPCGDFYWMRSLLPELNLKDYIGGDIVPEIVERLQESDGAPDVSFDVIDVTTDRLPGVDLVLCRDLLGHFSNADVQKALRQIRDSGSKYLLATTFSGHDNLGDIVTGEWRPINLASLFGLPDPIELLNEGCEAGRGKFIDKCLGLWRIN